VSALDADSVRARLFLTLQYLLPQHFVSRLAYRITRSACRSSRTHSSAASWTIFTPT